MMRRFNIHNGRFNIHNSNFIRTSTNSSINRVLEIESQVGSSDWGQARLDSGQSTSSNGPTVGEDSNCERFSSEQDYSSGTKVSTTEKEPSSVKFFNVQ